VVRFLAATVALAPAARTRGRTRPGLLSGQTQNLHCIRLLVPTHRQRAVQPKTARVRLADGTKPFGLLETVILQRGRVLDQQMHPRLTQRPTHVLHMPAQDRLVRDLRAVQQPVSGLGLVRRSNHAGDTTAPAATSTGPKRVGDLHQPTRTPQVTQARVCK